MLVNQILYWLRHEPDSTRSHAHILDRSNLVLATTIGSVRKENQDRVVALIYRSSKVERSFFATVICDGMGGMRDGAECANIALSSFVDNLLVSSKADFVSKIREAILHANKEVSKLYYGNGGSTLSVLLLTGENKWYAANVGDTRLYRVRIDQKKTRKILQISIDDSIQAQLEKMDVFSSRSDIGEDFSNSLAQYVGMNEQIDPHVVRLEGVSVNDKFVIASDGLYTVGEKIIDKIIDSSPTLAKASFRLLELSNWVGGEDNATISIVDAHINDNESMFIGRAGVELWKATSQKSIIFDETSIFSEKEKIEKYRENIYRENLNKINAAKHRHGVKQKHPVATNISNDDNEFKQRSFPIDEESKAYNESALTKKGKDKNTEKGKKSNQDAKKETKKKQNVRIIIEKDSGDES